MRGDQVLPLITLDVPTLRVPQGPGPERRSAFGNACFGSYTRMASACRLIAVLVCTFNRVIRDDLSAALAAELEPYGLEVPRVTTLHGLAARLAPEISRFLLSQETEAMLYDVREVEPTIDDMYESRQSRVMRALREHEAGLGTHTALVTAVRTWLATHGAELVGELPRLVETRLRNGDFADERYDHIIIDEFQDLTETETRLALGLEQGTAKSSPWEIRSNRSTRSGARGAPP